MTAPDPLAALLPEALCREYHPMHWDVAYGNRTKPCEACRIHAAHLAAVLRDAGYEHGPTARAEALDEAADNTDLSAYYDPSPTGGISTSCHLAENAARDWLSARAARLREHDGGTQ